MNWSVAKVNPTDDFDIDVDDFFLGRILSRTHTLQHPFIILGFWSNLTAYPNFISNFDIFSLSCKIGEMEKIEMVATTTNTDNNRIRAVEWHSITSHINLTDDVIEWHCMYNPPLANFNGRIETYFWLWKTHAFVSKKNKTIGVSFFFFIFLLSFRLFYLTDISRLTNLWNTKSNCKYWINFSLWIVFDIIFLAQQWYVIHSNRSISADMIDESHQQ